MATLCVLRFTSALGAAAALDRIRSLVRVGALNVTDGSTISWEPGQRSPTVCCLLDISLQQRLNEFFWCTLFGVIFYLPLAASFANVSRRAAHLSLAAFGISDDFLLRARERITPGTYGLFLLAIDATVDRVVEALPTLDFTVTSTNLTHRQLAALQAAFAPCSTGLRPAAGHYFQ